MDAAAIARCCSRAAESSAAGVVTHRADNELGLPDAYAEGALARARIRQTAIAASESLVALQEIADVLDRRIPHLERAGEALIAADAKELRAAVMLRIALMRNGADKTFHGADRTLGISAGDLTPSGSMIA